MDDHVTGTDVGKPIIDANGDRLGCVARVEDGTAIVELTDDAPSLAVLVLGWSDRGCGDDTYPLVDAHIDAITDEGIHLESNL